MALVLTPLGKNAARLACSGCESALVVTVKPPVRLRLLAQRVAQDHRCSAKS